jgi:3-oxoadipate CoA-transferase, alpha subunit
MALKNKVHPGFLEAIRDIPDGATIGFGGFALPGLPGNLILALAEQGAKDLTLVANTTGGTRNDPGIGMLVARGQVRKAICAFTAATRASQKLPFTEFYEAGRVEAELVPQGTLAERMRAAGAGIPAFFTPTAVGTRLGMGKETREFDGRTYVMEHALPGDVALVEAWEADRWGNLTFRESGRNFNPVMAMAAKLTIVQSQHIVELGALEPEHVVTPGIFVDRVLHVPYGDPPTF